MDLVLALEYDSTVPLFRRLSDALRKAIIEGRLQLGHSLPSVRELAWSLGVSRSTVLRCFQDLQSQGYIEAKKGLVTKVVRTLPGDLSGMMVRSQPASQEERSSSVVFSAFAQRLLANAETEVLEEPHGPQTNYGGTPLNLLPLQQWKRLLVANCRFKDLSRLAYAVDAFGYAPLREALTAYLSRSRAVNCTSEQIVVFAGRELRLDLICRILLDAGDFVAVENPGFAQFRHRLASHGANIVPISLDRHGIDVRQLAERKERFKFVVVTPSHHEPLGVVMSLERRRRLIEWAKETQTFLLEDDYDCEYRYSGKALPSLQGLDDGGWVIHMRCFWRVLFPIMRLGFLVVPHRLIDVVRLAKSKVERDPPLLEQFALTDFINEGILERHIHRTQPIYASRRQALIYALTKCFGRAITIMPSSTGLEILVQFHLATDVATLLSVAERCGVSMVSTSSYYLSNPEQWQFLLPFGHLGEEELSASIERFAERLAAITAFSR